jgi:hypothetical protein
MKVASKPSSRRHALLQPFVFPAQRRRGLIHRMPPVKAQGMVAPPASA